MSKILAALLSGVAVTLTYSTSTLADPPPQAGYGLLRVCVRLATKPPPPCIPDQSATELEEEEEEEAPF